MIVKPLHVTRIDDGDDHRYVTEDGHEIAGITTILGAVLGKPKGIPATYLERGRLLHLYIYRALAGVNVTPPPADDAEAMDAWQRFERWQAWRARCFADAAPVLVSLGEHVTAASINGLPFACTVDGVGSLGWESAIFEWKRSLNALLMQQYALQMSAQRIALGAHATLAEPALFAVGQGPAGVFESHRLDFEPEGVADVLRRYYDGRKV